MKDELRNWSGWLFLTIVMIGLVSCSQSSDCFQVDVFCAALVTDTQGIEDQGMNQDTWAGLEQAKAEGIVQRVEYIKSIDSRDYEKNIAYFADLGFDAIFTVGVGMDDETLRAAELYPFDPAQGGVGTVFVGLNQPQSESRPNLIPVTFPEDQMGFVAGAFAARISETQIVGAVCETSGIDSMWRYCEGFRAGVDFFNKEAGAGIKSLVVYREDGDREKLFLDEAWGAETAQGLIQRGADVIFAAGGATGQGALQTAAEAGVQTIGSESGPGGVTSVLGDASSVVRQILQREPLSPKIKYVPLDQTFPEHLTREMDLLLSALQNGEVKTNVTSSKP
jgi:basic membrane protein A